MGTHISLLGNIYSYRSYPGYNPGTSPAVVTNLLDDVLELSSFITDFIFRLLRDHLIGMTLKACI